MSDKVSYVVGLGIAIGVAFAIMSLNLGALFADMAAIPLPVYFSFKATQTADGKDDTQWLMYWSIYGLLKLLDHVDAILEWVPLFPIIKVGFIVWLWLPLTNGATTLYFMLVAPFFKKHEARIDAALDTANEKVVKGVKAGIEKVGSEVRQRLAK